MNELMSEVNGEKYLSRMSNVVDKNNIVSFLKNPDNDKILDFGCGDGPMSDYFSPDNYIGFDISEFMVQKAQSKHPRYRFVSELHDEKFNAILFSSVLHEVYAYNNHTFEDVVNCLVNMKKHLQPYGRFVIRDGILPDIFNPCCNLHSVPAMNFGNCDDDKTFVNHPVVAKNPEDAMNFLKFLQHNSSFDFGLQIDRNGVFSGNFSDLVHFLNVYTWGWGSVEREKNERVNVFSLENWCDIFEKAGFNIIEKHVITQDDYFVHLEKFVALNGLRWETKVFFVLEEK